MDNEHQKALIKIVEDDQGTIALSESSACLQHVDIKYQLIWSELNEGKNVFEYCATPDTDVDVLNIPVTKSKIEICVGYIFAM